MSGDAQYLQATVGPALAKGVAECVYVGPDDPVAFLGNWLKAHVQNASIKQTVANESAKIEAQANAQAKELELRQKTAKAERDQRELAVQQV